MKTATRPISIDGLDFDALIDSEIQYEADVPSYPVETGFEISDTVILKPMVLSMTLYLTNTPVTWHGRNTQTVEQRMERLRQIYLAAKPVVVSTFASTHKNMVLQSYTDVKSIETGTSREVPVVFHEVRETESKTTTIPDGYGRAQPTGVYVGTADTTKGTSSSSKTTPAQEGSKGSILSGLGKHLS